MVREVNCWTLPVSISVRLIRYSVMIPFLASSGGGVQVIPMDVELTTDTFRFSGGLEGAVWRKNVMQNVQREKN